MSKAAEILPVRRATLSDLLHGKAALTPEMALRIEKAFGPDIEHLLRMQLAYDVWKKQFQAITGSAGWAVLIQAILFGIGHLYEGVGPVARITLFGGLFGLLALWRKSLRPGMIAHPWSDIFGVIIFRGI